MLHLEIFCCKMCLCLPKWSVFLQFELLSALQLKRQSGQTVLVISGCAVNIRLFIFTSKLYCGQSLCRRRSGPDEEHSTEIEKNNSILTQLQGIFFLINCKCHRHLRIFTGPYFYQDVSNRKICQAAGFKKFLWNLTPLT